MGHRKQSKTKGVSRSSERAPATVRRARAGRPLYPIGYTHPMNSTLNNVVQMRKASCAVTKAGRKQRILFMLAGTFTVTGTALAAGVSHWFALIPAAVGANQLLMAAAGWCPMSRLLDRILPGQV